MPVPGNHEYETDGAAPYFDYFGAAAGDPAEGWHTFDLGDWHLIALNSNCDAVGGCDEASPRQLARGRSRRSLASRLHPGVLASPALELGRTSTAPTPPQTPSGSSLHDAGADVVLVGHDHQYERFVPMDADGAADPRDGRVRGGHGRAVAV